MIYLEYGLRMMMYYGLDKVHTLKSNNFLAELFPPYHTGILCSKQNSMIKQHNLTLVSLSINPFINVLLSLIIIPFLTSIAAEDMITIKRKLKISDE